MNKINRNRIIRFSYILAILSLVLLNIIPAQTILHYGNVYASETNEIILNNNEYSDETEYLQYCLNKLGYTDSENNVLYTDGFFGDSSISAINKFLQAQGLASFNIEAKNLLMSLAESTSNKPNNNDLNINNNGLFPTAFIYSSVSNVNNSNDPFYSMSMLKTFPYIITSRPDQMSYKSKRVIDNIKSKTKVFGYINLGPNNPTANKSKWIQADLNKLKSQIDLIADQGWYGVFVDQFGYDWKETRKRQNIIIDYIHSKGLKAMVNSWFIDDALGSKVDAAANPNGTASHLNSNDWCLVESFFTDGTSYRADNSYIKKYIKIKQYKDRMGINIAVLSYKKDSLTWEQSKTDIKNSYILAKSLGFNGWWFGKTDNSDYLLYGKEPNINLGALTKPLKLVSGNKYTAETKNYKIEYYAKNIPTLKLIAKK